MYKLLIKYNYKELNYKTREVSTYYIVCSCVAKTVILYILCSALELSTLSALALLSSMLKLSILSS